MNSFYGVLGTSACRFYDPRLANAITGFGRELLLWCKGGSSRTGGACSTAIPTACSSNRPARRRRGAARAFGEALAAGSTASSSAYLGALAGRQPPRAGLRPPLPPALPAGDAPRHRRRPQALRRPGGEGRRRETRRASPGWRRSAGGDWTASLQETTARGRASAGRVVFTGMGWSSDWTDPPGPARAVLGLRDVGRGSARRADSRDRLDDCCHKGSCGSRPRPTPRPRRRTWPRRASCPDPGAAAASPTSSPLRAPSPPRGLHAPPRLRPLRRQADSRRRGAGADAPGTRLRGRRRLPQAAPPLLS